MIKKNGLAKLAISLIVALVLSSSVCLWLLTGIAMAAEMSAAGAPSAAAPDMSICAPSFPIPASNQPQIARTQAAGGIPDCCVNQNQTATAVASHVVSVSHLLSAIYYLGTGHAPLAFVSGFNRQIAFLPPPQAAGLQSVVKRE